MRVDEGMALQQFKNILLQYDKIVLYGAGIWGGRILDCIYEWRLYKKVIFAVTDVGDSKEYMGIDVVAIDSIKECSDNYIIVVSVGEELTDELCTYLNKKRIGPYISLNRSLRKAFMEDGIYEMLRKENEKWKKTVIEEIIKMQKENWTVNTQLQREFEKESTELQDKIYEETAQVLKKTVEETEWLKKLAEEMIQLQRKTEKESILLNELYQKLTGIENRLDRLDVLTILETS